MRRWTVLVAAIAVGFTTIAEVAGRDVVTRTAIAAPAADDLSDIDRKVLETLADSRAEGGMVFHWDAREVAAADVEDAVRRNRGFYAEVEKALAVKPPVPVHVFLHRDLPRLQVLTGAAPSVAAFSAGHSIHQTIDYDECHEFVHVFAQHLPKDAESVPPEGFFVEGLATALQKKDKGVPISTWAAMYARCGRLPPLVALRRTWPQGAPTGVHPYHVAGSFLDFAIQRFGIERVRRYYTHCLECQGVLGTSFAALETEWRKWLAEREVPAEQELFVLRVTGLGEDRVMPESLRARKRVPLFDGKTLDAWRADADGVWSAKGGVLTGRTAGKFTYLRVPAPKGNVLGVRVVFRMLEGTACQVRLNDGPAGSNQAIFAAWNTYFGIDGASGFVGAIGQDEWRFTPGLWHEAIVVNEVVDGSRVGRIYADGLRAVEVKAGVVVQDGRIGVGIEEGAVEIAAVEAILAE